MTEKNAAPDWPPRQSATDYPEGWTRRGSTGQLFIVKDGKWVRVLEDNKPFPAQFSMISQHGS